MNVRSRSSDYYWPVITAILVAFPLYEFRNEGSTVHFVFRVVWSIVLLVSLITIGRQLHRDLRHQRRPVAQSSGSQQPDEANGSL
jgi:hypothetical protein